MQPSSPVSGLRTSFSSANISRNASKQNLSISGVTSTYNGGLHVQTDDSRAVEVRPNAILCCILICVVLAVCRLCLHAAL